MRICHYEDRDVSGLGPFTLTRPVAALLCGLDTLAQKQARYFPAGAVGHLCRPAMAGLMRATNPDAMINDPHWLRAAPTVLVNARWVPPAPTTTRQTPANPFINGPHIAMAGNDIAYAVLDPQHLQAVSLTTVDDCLNDWTQSLPLAEVGGSLLSRPWDLLEKNAEQIAIDFEADADQTAAGFYPEGFQLVGPAERLFIHPSARIDPMVVADTTNGPVSVGAGAVVHSFTRLEGPCGVGVGSVLLGAKVRAGTTIGPHCRVGGEVEASILLGYVNKYHEGFLGHSVIGEWVNLAAGTHTADLRYDYQPISVPVGGVMVSTGHTKVGAMIGDHARTGLGVLFDCGTAVGPFARVLPCGGFAPREVPAFHQAGPDGLKELTHIERILAAADTAMRRRGQMLSPELETVYRAAAQKPLSTRQHTVLPWRRVG